MIAIPQETLTNYSSLLVQQNVPLQDHSYYYKKWLRYYWDFCHKYQLDINKPESLAAFIAKLRSKHQSKVHKI